MNAYSNLLKQGLVALLFGVCTMTFTSCGDDYDDTAIRKELSELDERVSALESWQTTVNTNISSLQSLVENLQEKNFITSVTQITENGVEVGYTITFQTGTSITIKNGKDGENGKDGSDGTSVNAPKIGVAKDTDGVYYWTLDGEFLLDDNGNKIRVTGEKGEKGDKGDTGETGNAGKDGADGITPQVEIDSLTNEWKISYDSGETWIYTGVIAKGEKGDKGDTVISTDSGCDCEAIFSGVEWDEEGNVVYFYLTDDTSIAVPMANSISIWFDSYDVFEITAEQNTMNVNIEGLTSSNYRAITAELKTDAGIDVSVKTRAENGAIIITEPGFDGETGELSDSVVVIFNKTYDGAGVLKVTIIDDHGNEVSTSRAVNMRMIVSKADDILFAIKDETTQNVVMELSNDVAIDSLCVTTEKELLIELNDYELSITGDVVNNIWNGADITIRNGSLHIDVPYNTSGLFVSKGGRLTLENITLTDPSDIVTAQGEGTILTMKNCYIRTTPYGFSTNAQRDKTTGEFLSGKDATILIEGCLFDGGETGFLNNVPANITLRNSEFIGNHQGALLRGGTYTIENCVFTLNATLPATHSENKYSTAWSGGNQAAFAALTIGNRNSSSTSTSYMYPTTVTMKGTIIQNIGVYASSFPAMYVYANSGDENGVTITYDSACTFMSEFSPAAEYASSNIIVNGSAATINTPSK